MAEYMCISFEGILELIKQYTKLELCMFF